MKLLIVLVLISATFNIKIKISQSGGGDNYSQSRNMGGWNTIRTCEPLAPSIQVGTLFSIYAE